MARFLNKRVRIKTIGPYEDRTEEKPDKKYFNFLLRDKENYDMIKIYFNDNYENDLNEYQKEYYLKNLDKLYNEVLKKMKEYKKEENFNLNN